MRRVDPMLVEPSCPEATVVGVPPPAGPLITEPLVNPFVK
jgi:hypothetical protein